MKTIQLNCADRGELHDIFERELGAPYGRNLDALHDRLSELSEPLCIVLEETKLCAALGDRYFDNLLRMLRDTAQENSNLCIKLQ